MNKVDQARELGLLTQFTVLFDREDYLDYLHMQEIKQASSKRLTLAEVKQACNLI